MLSFFEFITEKVLSIGLNPEHEKYRTQHMQDMHDMLVKSYHYVGGYAGLGSGSEEESKAIHSDLSNPDHIIKVIKRGSAITALAMYKPQFGRKGIASATDGTAQGVKDWKKMRDEDSRRHGWAETSHKATAALKKLGYPEIPIQDMQRILSNKKLTPTSGNKYTREIGGHEHEKLGMGYPKLD